MELFPGPFPVPREAIGQRLVTIWSTIGVLWFRHHTCKLLISKGFYKNGNSKTIGLKELLIRRSLVRAQVEEPLQAL
jgi:hypothetical protein